MVVNVVLVRYAEVGLKSPGVRRHFESILIDNVEAALIRRRIEALVSCEAGRIFVRTDQTQDAVPAIIHVFGVASVSPAIECGSAMEEMQDAAAGMSRDLLGQGTSFAVKARREGSHPYTSMDVGREVGSAIYLANEDKNVKVNLTRPDVTIYVEVRGRKAFVFDRYVPGPGGLPLGSQGKVVASVHGERDALAAWMLMKRGCKVLVWGDEHADILDAWDPRLRRLDEKTVWEAVHGSRVLGMVSGDRLEDIDLSAAACSHVPIFHPLVGMTEAEVRERLDAITL